MNFDIETGLLASEKSGQNVCAAFLDPLHIDSAFARIHTSLFEHHILRQEALDLHPALVLLSCPSRSCLNSDPTV